MFKAGLPAKRGEKGKQSSFLKGLVEEKVGYTETLGLC